MSVLMNTIGINRGYLFISSSKTAQTNEHFVDAYRDGHAFRETQDFLDLAASAVHRPPFLVFSHNWNQPLGSCHILSGLTFL